MTALVDRFADASPSVAATALVAGMPPAYATRRGAVYQGDALDLLRAVPDGSINLVVTSPPYALEFKKEYGNEPQAKYVEWFLPFASEVHRVLRTDGSLVVNIGGAWQKGHPVRSLYHFRLLLELVETVGFFLAQEVYWHNPAKMPTPAEWVNVQRIRVKDSVEPCWWLSKSERPKASNRNVLVPYSDDMIRLIDRGFRAKQRPSGHRAKLTWQKDLGGAIPGNVLTMGNNDSNGRYIAKLTKGGLKVHPARFPVQLPEWFIRFLTDPGDVVLDIFGGSMTTGWAAERLDRAWLGFELSAEYVEASRLRFFDDDGRLLDDAELGTARPVVGNGHRPRRSAPPTSAFAMGQPTAPVDKALRLAAELEDEGIICKLARGL
jgi:site-specific DNA-methyltransferase (cytosine-N4-specific)